MTNSCIRYESELKKAKDTLATLLKHRQDIDAKLLINPISSELHKDLRTVNLEIRITNNEIELVESNLLECESKINQTT